MLRRDPTGFLNYSRKRSVHNLVELVRTRPEGNSSVSSCIKTLSTLRDDLLTPG